ncbi:Ribokinase-like protein [Zopfochytrium polystomum]|nr:Ribokinase-like protein [Zopfochytrium polystomum]
MSASPSAAIVAAAVRAIVPPLLPVAATAASAVGSSPAPSSHSISAAAAAAAAAALHPPPPPTRKGQCGRVLVVGGSEEYCGAPFFAGMAALRTGADICHIVCDASSSPVIKGFSPDLIVHPYLRNESTYTDTAPTPALAISAISSRISTALLPRVHVVVIGPGLSRDAVALGVAERVAAAACGMGLPVVLDADGLHMLTRSPGLLRASGGRAVVTPNRGEFERLCEAVGVPLSPPASGSASAASTAAAEELSRRLGGVVVVEKGAVDVVTDGSVTLLSTASSSPRRCGGLGDILAGVLATFVAWSTRPGASSSSSSSSSSSPPPLVASAMAASAVARRAALRGFAARGRSMVARDVLEEVGGAFVEVCGK